MALNPNATLASLLSKHEQSVLDEWVRLQLAGLGRRDETTERDLRDHSRRFAGALRKALASGASDDVHAPAWAEVRARVETKTPIEREARMKGKVTSTRMRKFPTGQMPKRRPVASVA